MTKSSVILRALIIAIVLMAILPTISGQEDETDLITIDDMKSSSGWEKIEDESNNQIGIMNISIVDNGLKILYNLPRNESWVDMYKDIDFGKMPEMQKILFQYSGSGAPNTLELKLVYEDGSNFGYARNMATNSSGLVSLDPWQITYWWGGYRRPTGEPVDFSKVRQIHIAISNKPEKNDIAGKGFIIIGSVFGIKKQFEPSFLEKYKDIIVATITGLFGLGTGLFVMKKRNKVCV